MPETGGGRNRKTGETITDLGEKLGGARKDRVTLASMAEMTAKERQAEATRERVWPWDAAEAVAGGMPATVAWAVDQVRKGVARQPNLKGLSPRRRGRPDIRRGRSGGGGSIPA